MAKQDKDEYKGKGKEIATPLHLSAGGLSIAVSTQTANLQPFTCNALRNIRRDESKKIENQKANKEQGSSNPKWDNKIQHCNSRIKRYYCLYKNSVSYIHDVVFRIRILALDTK